LKIGILGGTFDPPHVAHLALARAAIEQLELEEVIFMPVAKNPLKHRAMASSKQRLAMVELLIKGQAKLAVSDLEISRGGQSYAVDTLEELQAAQPADYWFIVGSDALKELANWKNPERLLRLCRIAAALRPPYSETQMVARIPEEFRDRVDFITMEPMEVASFDIRDRLAREKPVKPMIPDSVLDFIRQNKLYRS
jgi:nicotinate-nucleotide adenylyltransferase